MAEMVDFKVDERLDKVALMDYWIDECLELMETITKGTNKQETMNILGVLKNNMRIVKEVTKELK